MTYRFDEQLEADFRDQAWGPSGDQIIDVESVREMIFDYVMRKLAAMEIELKERIFNYQGTDLLLPDMVHETFVNAVPNRPNLQRKDENHRGIHTCDGRCAK